MAKKPDAGILVGPIREDGTVGRKPGQTAVRNPDIRKVQAIALMREMSLNGGNLTSAAAKFNLSIATARARLSEAQRAGLFTQHEDTLLTGMVPRAENMLLRFLEPVVVRDKEGQPVVDAETGQPVVLPPSKDQAAIAVQVMKGVGLFRRPGTIAPAVAEGGKKRATLADHIAELRAKAAEDNGERPLALPEEAVDVEFSEVRELAAIARLAAGDDESSGEAAPDSGVPAESDARDAETPGEANGLADEEAGDGHGADPESLPGQVEPGAEAVGQGDSSLAPVQ